MSLKVMMLKSGNSRRVELLLHENEQTRDENKASVLVIRELSTNSLLLTQRPEHLDHHPGEICFPGGRMEAQDESLQHTALRETFEEIGLNIAQNQVLVPMKPVITLRRVCIYPWYTEIESLPSLDINLEEVKAVMMISFNKAINPNLYHSFAVEKEGFKVHSVGFDYMNTQIWGATAKIMQQLSEGSPHDFTHIRFG